MDYTQWFAERLAKLRTEKGVSARDMSLSLGQSESYINKIENHRTLPSMTGFFYICEYLGITPADFFSLTTQSPTMSNEILKLVDRLSPSQTQHIMEILKDLTEK